MNTPKVGERFILCDDSGLVKHIGTIDVHPENLATLIVRFDEDMELPQLPGVPLLAACSLEYVYGYAHGAGLHTRTMGGGV